MCIKLLHNVEASTHYFIYKIVHCLCIKKGVRLYTQVNSLNNYNFLEKVGEGWGA